MTEHPQSAYFVDVSEDYLQAEGKRGVIAYLNHLLKKWLRPPARLLELGCEGGRNVISLQGRGYEVTGLDISRRALRHAAHESRQKNLSILWVQGDALHLPLAGGIFAGVIMARQFLSVFHGRSTRRQILQEAYRVLCKEGVVIASIQNGVFDPGFRHFIYYIYARLFIYPWPQWRVDKMKEIFMRFKQICQVKSYLRKQIPENRRDLHISTRVSNEWRANVPFHIYHLDELIEDLKATGFQVIDWRDFVECERNITIPELFRRGAPYLTVVARKVTG